MESPAKRTACKPCQEDCMYKNHHGKHFKQIPIHGKQAGTLAVWYSSFVIVMLHVDCTGTLRSVFLNTPDASILASQSSWSLGSSELCFFSATLCLL